jgi:hypothetical protein
LGNELASGRGAAATLVPTPDRARSALDDRVSRVPAPLFHRADAALAALCARVFERYRAAA